MFNSVFKFSAGFENDTRHIAHKGHIIVRAAIPICTAPLQCFVIGFFGLLNKFFQTDIFPNDITILIKQQQC